VVELDEEVEVAPRRVEISARRRAKNIEPPHVETAAQSAQFLPMQCNVGDHQRLQNSDKYSMATAQPALRIALAQKETLMVIRRTASQNHEAEALPRASGPPPSFETGASRPPQDEG